MADVLDTEISEPGDELAERFACRLFRISGVVQGVFFRSSTQTAARDLGISGYAKNCTDGTVEVLACGSQAAIAELAGWLQHGPPMAKVTRVESNLQPYRDLDRFTTA